MKNYEPVIGLEIHLQLNTKSKMFCSCRSGVGEELPPNTAICPGCTGRPGTLPAINKAAVDAAIKMAFGLNFEINKTSTFARKNYFYPDLARGYQITQDGTPVCVNGHLMIDGARIGITRAHLEEDTAKMFHEKGCSLLDFNRSGVALIEIVSEPDMRTPEQAYGYLTEFKKIMQWLGISNCDMEKGELRVDVNVSLREAGSTAYGTRVEIKNINSFKAVKDALTHEIERQSALLNAGKPVVRHTMTFDKDKCVTIPMRSKENAMDYRYFPEPDMPALVISDEWINEIKAALPELPAQYKARFESKYGLSAYDAGVLTASKALADYYEAVVNAKANPKNAANWITTDLLGYLNSASLQIEDSPVTPQQLAELVALTDGGKISRAQAKRVFEEVCKTKESPAAAVERLGLSQVSDAGSIDAWIKEAIAENDKIAAQIKAGKVTAIGALVGAVMRKSKGTANPALVNDLLKKHFGVE